MGTEISCGPIFIYDTIHYRSRANSSLARLCILCQYTSWLLAGIAGLSHWFSFLYFLGEIFWHALERIKIIALSIAISLYVVRLLVFQLEGPFFLTVIESWSWLFAVFGFGATYLNKSSSVLTYLSKAVYPVYILHMIFLNLSAYLILPKPVSINMTTYVIYVETRQSCAKSRSNGW